MSSQDEPDKSAGKDRPRSGGDVEKGWEKDWKDGQGDSQGPKSGLGIASEIYGDERGGQRPKRPKIRD